MEKRRRLLFVSGMIVLILLLAVGCTKQTAEAPPKVKVYSNDGLLGITDANPNLPLNPSYHTYTVDRNMVLSVIKQVPGISSTRIIFNGPNLYVYLKLPKGLNPTDIAQIQEAAFKAISLNMPRYRVNVIVGRNKLYESG